MSEEPGSNNGKRKRQRVSQACERCRAKKYRCDGGGPPCAACHSAGTECSYGQAGQRRGLKTGYVKVLEMLWGLVLKEVPNSEHVASRLLATLSREDLDSNSNSQPALQAWRSSGLPSSIASLLDDELLDDNNRHEELNRAHGPLLTSPWNLDRATASEDPTERATANSHAQPLASGPATLPMTTQCERPRNEEPTTSAALPPGWHQQVQAYLSYEESWLPVLPKSALWRTAYAYEASCESSSGPGSQPRGDVATLWAALVLGEMHLNGSTSVTTEALQTRAHALLTPLFSSEPDSSYAPAFLLWSVVHMGRREFTSAKMKLVQAFVLTASLPTSSPAMSGHSLLTNACFVMDVLLALATYCKPIDIGSNSLAAEAREREPTDWEPFVDPLKNSSSQSRPSRTYSTYDQFLKLCTLLYTVSPGMNLWRGSEDSFNDWSARLPSHLKYGSSSASPDHDPRLPAEVNIHFFSLLFRSRFAESERGASLQHAPLTFDTTAGTEVLKTLCSLQRQQWDVRRYPLSFGTIVHLLSMEISKCQFDHFFEEEDSLLLPSLRKLVADFSAHYAWRWPEHTEKCAPITISETNLALNEAQPGNLRGNTTNPSVDLRGPTVTQQVTGTSAPQDTTVQQRAGEVRYTHTTHSDQTHPIISEDTVLGQHDLRRLADGNILDPMISNPDDSLFPGAYLDLFDSDESGDRDFMRALGFLDDTEGFQVTEPP